MQNQFFITGDLIKVTFQSPALNTAREWNFCLNSGMMATRRFNCVTPVSLECRTREKDQLQDILAVAKMYYRNH